MSLQLGACIDKLGKFWRNPSWHCHLDYSTDCQKNDARFDIDWFLRQLQNDVRLAAEAFDAQRVYTSSSSVQITVPSHPKPADRARHRHQR